MSQTIHPMLNIAVRAARAAGSIINRAALDLDVLQLTLGNPFAGRTAALAARSLGITVIADDDNGAGIISECHEDNNEETIEKGLCK